MKKKKKREHNNHNPNVTELRNNDSFMAHNTICIFSQNVGRSTRLAASQLISATAISPSLLSYVARA